MKKASTSEEIIVQVFMTAFPCLHVSYFSYSIKKWLWGVTQRTKTLLHTKATNLSASSRMRISILFRVKFGELWRWSMRRPGVAMTTSGPSLNAAS